MQRSSLGLPCVVLLLLLVLLATAGRVAAIEPLQQVSLAFPSADVSCSTSFGAWSASGACWDYNVQNCPYSWSTTCTPNTFEPQFSTSDATYAVAQIITLPAGSEAANQGLAGTLRFTASANANRGFASSVSLKVDCRSALGAVLVTDSASATSSSTSLSRTIACPASTTSLRVTLSAVVSGLGSSTFNVQFSEPQISLAGAPSAPASVSTSSVLATSTALSWAWTNSAPTTQPFGSFDGKVCTGSGLTGTCASISTPASLSSAISALSVGTAYYVGVRACGSSVSSATCSAFTTTSFQTQDVKYLTTYGACSACNSTVNLVDSSCITATTSTPTAMVDCRALPVPASTRSCNPVSDWVSGQCVSTDPSSGCSRTMTRSYTTLDAVFNAASCELSSSVRCQCPDSSIASSTVTTGPTSAGAVVSSNTPTSSGVLTRNPAATGVSSAAATSVPGAATSVSAAPSSSGHGAATASVPGAASSSVPGVASTVIPDAGSSAVPGAASSSPVVGATSTDSGSTIASAAIPSHTPSVSSSRPGAVAPDPSGASSSTSLIGPIVGAVLGVLLLLIIILVVARRRRQRQSKRSTSSLELVPTRSQRRGPAPTDDHIQMIPNQLSAPANNSLPDDALYASAHDMGQKSEYAAAQDVALAGLYSSTQDASDHDTYAEVGKNQPSTTMNKAGPSGDQYATPASGASPSVAVGPLGDQYAVVDRSKKPSAAQQVVGPLGDQYAVVNKTSRSSVPLIDSADYEELTATPVPTTVGPNGDVYARPLRGASSSPSEPLYE